jgi:hypothetical protein
VTVETVTVAPSEVYVSPVTVPPVVPTVLSDTPWAAS